MQTAVLEFLAAAARTGIVAPHFGAVDHRLLSNRLLRVGNPVVIQTQRCRTNALDALLELFFTERIQALKVLFGAVQGN